MIRYLDPVWKLLNEPVFSAYIQLIFFCVILTGISAYYRFSEGKVIGAGIYISFFWLPTSMLVSLLMDHYWTYLMHWLLATIIFFAFYVLLIYLSGKYGNPYMGDGAMVMILPIYLTSIAFIGSIAIKGGIWLIRFIFHL